MKPKIYAIIVAAGSSKRFKGKDKLLIEIDRKPLIIHTLERFEKSQKITGIILVVKKSKINIYKKLVDEYDIKKVKKIVQGGETRQLSSFCGLKEVDRDTDIVLIHDGARPYVSVKLINKVIENTLKFRAVIPVLPVKETLKVVKNNYVAITIPRENLFFAQTPQGFSYKLLWNIYKNLPDIGKYFTDDAQVLEKTKNKVRVIKGEPQNIKITTQEDLIC